MDLFREAMKEYYYEKIPTSSIFSRSNILNNTVDSLVVVLHIVPKSIL